MKKKQLNKKFQLPQEVKVLLIAYFEEPYDRNLLGKIERVGEKYKDISCTLIGRIFWFWKREGDNIYQLGVNRHNCRDKTHLVTLEKPVKQHSCWKNYLPGTPEYGAVAI